MIIGTGIDIIGIERTSKLLESGGDRFRERWFGPREIAYCESKAKPCLHYAARLAAKEAAVKALRLQWEGAPAWKDIQVEVAPSGAPSISLEGRAAQEAARLGVAVLHLSLSHCDEYATASVIAEGPAAPSS